MAHSEVMRLAAAEILLDVVRGEIEDGDMSNNPVVRITMNKRTLAEFTQCRKDVGEFVFNVFEYEGTPLVVDDSLDDAMIECHGLGEGPVGVS